MREKYYIVDAFTDHLFSGGPAGVVITEEWLSDEMMQNIAAENNLADTAFLVPAGDGEYGLRWFMPEGEIMLNGHATLAAAFVLFHYEGETGKEIRFLTASGVLKVGLEGEYIVLDLPAVYNKPVKITDEMIHALKAEPAEAYFGENYFFIFDTEKEIRNLQPDFEKMKQLPEGQGVFVSAKSEDDGFDIAGRTFWPKMGVNEDPVCGNMHCNLAPFWCDRLKKKQIVSHQLSKREAVVICEYTGDDRVRLKGKAALYLTGELHLQ